MPRYLRHFRLKGLRMTHVNKSPHNYGVGYQTLHIDQPAGGCPLDPQPSSLFVIMECVMAIAFVVLGNDLRHRASDAKMRGH